MIWALQEKTYKITLEYFEVPEYKEALKFINQSHSSTGVSKGQRSQLKELPRDFWEATCPTIHKVVSDYSQSIK